MRISVLVISLACLAMTPGDAEARIQPVRRVLQRCHQALQNFRPMQNVAERRMQRQAATVLSLSGVVCDCGCNGNCGGNCGCPNCTCGQYGSTGGQPGRPLAASSGIEVFSNPGTPVKGRWVCDGNTCRWVPD